MSSKRPVEPENLSESNFKKFKRILGNSSGSSTSQPSTQQNASGSAQGVWIRFGSALRGLEKCSGVVPSLQPTIRMIAECFKELPEADKRRQEFCDLASDLAALIDNLTEHIQKTNSTLISNCVTNIVNALQEDLTRIQNQQQQKRLSRIGTAIQEEDELIKYYRRIEAHFRRLQINASLGMWRMIHEHIANARLDRLAPAKQARYDSAQSSESRRRTCNPNTRVAVLTGLHGWSSCSDSPKLYWMSGMAGTGKTTIAYSLSDALQKTCQLGASFFCSRLLPECRDVNKIIPTIAYQLSRFSLPFQSALCEFLVNDPDAGQCDIRQQFENLVMGPLLASKDSMPTNVVVVIDALDECSDNNGTRDILDLLFHHSTELSIKFFVTSRPEPTISDKMLAADDHTRSVFFLHEIEKTIVQADIETYLSSELARISPPPTRDQVHRLAEQAGRLFIYAATALRYICPGDPIIDSRGRLQKILEMASGPRGKVHSEIDGLYTAILEAVFNNSRLDEEDVRNVWLVLHTVICLMEPMTTKALTGFLGMADERKLLLLITPLQSVLYISSSTGLVSTLHASFPDYMLNLERSGKYFCDRKKHNELLAGRCFETMRCSLRFNICSLETSFVRDSDVPGLANRIDEAIMLELFYTCRYWGDHLLESGQVGELMASLKEFLIKRVLLWMEVLNLKRCVSTGTLILSKAHGWLLKCNASAELLGTCLETQKFVTVYGANPISESTPHIYVSLLSFWDKKGILWKLYGNSLKGMVKVDGPAVERRSGSLAVWTTEHNISSIALSPDGTHVVSGSDDSTIRIWDAQSGRAVAGPFEGHTDVITSVAFSPDGARVVSGSSDRTIRIWDAQSGRAVADPFEEHTGRITSVAFSPDGTRVVSGSWDSTIQIWDAQSGRAVAGLFEGHTDGINSVAFSPDGARVVSGSDDRTIRIWDAQSGCAVAGPFEGHTSSINSVAFSPDGARVVSGSDDRTIRIWDAQSGRAVAGLFEGHTDGINSVAFSPDGARVVSGSDDRTIRIWDAQSGCAVAGPFEGHTSSINSVAFSPDGARVVSGSDDRTIRIWDAQSGRAVAGPFGHTYGITSVAFSPDGARVVSGSSDGTIRIWDAQSGRAVAGPFGHTDGINSVAFSPDGARVVSGSDDRTIRIWDAQSGRAVADPFEEHTGRITSVAFSPDGTRVVSGSWDSTIQIWDAQSGRAVAGPFGHTDGISSVAFSPDGARVVSGSYDSTIRIWDAQSGRAVAGPFEGHTGLISSVAFSPDGARVVSGSSDRTIRIWDAQSGCAVAGPFEGHTDLISSVVFSPNSAFIVSGSHEYHTHPCDSPGNCFGAVLSLEWHIDSDGWLVDDNSHILLWLPLDLCEVLKTPRNNVLISQRGYCSVSFAGASLGARWNNCISE